MGNDDYGPVRPHTKHLNKDTSGKRPAAAKSSKVETSRIKPSRGDRYLSKEQEKKWLFFDNWSVNTNKNYGEATFSLYDDDNDNLYDPVDHVAILLGDSSILDENDSHIVGNTVLKPSESVWQKRRRIAISERRVSCGSILHHQPETVDDDGFFITGTDSKGMQSTTLSGSSQNWTCFTNSFSACK